MPANGLRNFGFHSDDKKELAAALSPNMEIFADAEGKSDLSKIDAETAARYYMANALASDEIPAFTVSEVNGQGSEFKSLGTEALPLTGTQTVKFRQFYRKIPVYGSLVTVELDQSNQLLAIKSSLGEPHNVDPIAKLSPVEAIDIVRREAGYGSQYLDVAPRLFYYFDSKVERWRLAYIVENVFKHRMPSETEEPSPHLPGIADFFIDAHTGEVVAEVSRTQSAQPLFDTADDGLGASRRFIYTVDPVTFRRQMSDPVHNVHTFDFRFRDVGLMSSSLPGLSVATPPPPWDPAGVSAHANAVEVAAFLSTVLKRNSIDNQGGKLISSINCVWSNLGSNGQEWRNAAWIGTQMVYGQRPINGHSRSYALALDIVSHEVFHGVTQHTADLQYMGMPGALNESYSDIFGIIISNFRQPDHDQWNWEMGEDLNGTGVPLRDLSNPGKYDQPEHMNDYRQLPLDKSGDYGGIHINSGIHNKAAFLVITAKDAQNHPLFDVDSVSALFYQALSQYLSRTSSFSDSRQAVELVAKTLFRTDPKKDLKLAAISNAFSSVGII
jgi:Zn-dependent metalloprotease